MSAWWRFGAGRDIAPQRPSLTAQTAAFATLADWRAVQADTVTMQSQASQREAFVGLASAAATIWCVCCAREVAVPLPCVADNSEPNLRESLVCPHCRLNARSRAALGLLRESRPDADARVYLTEQASPAFVWLRRTYRHARGSEYAVTAERRAAIETWLAEQGAPGAIALEDVTALSHADASLDTIGSFDVLEHVPDYRRALSEFARVLKPGGELWLTVPFIEDRQDTVVRARVDANGGIEHWLPPEIHGDPMSDGVLCYYHFGWDLLDATRAAGFTDAAWCRTWAPGQALFGLWTLRARR
jgi:SAM-dependent methyltransferase